MTPESPAPGCICLLGQDQNVVKVLFDGLGISTPTPPFHLEEIADQANREKVRNFLQTAERDILALRWEINIRLEEEIRTFETVGLKCGAETIVLMAEDLDGLLGLTEMLPSEYGRQAVLLRTALKNCKAKENAAWSRKELLEDLFRMNNELLTIHRELILKNSQLIKINEQKNLLLGMAAHDLRSPLANIRQMCELLEAELVLEDNSPASSILTMMRQSSQHLLNLVTDILDYSQIESGKLNLNLQLFDIAFLFGTHEPMLRLMAEKKGIFLICLFEKNLPFINADPHKLLQVLDNLTFNAIKFCSAGDQITLRLNADNGLMNFTVADTGPGIAPEEQEKLFLPFTKTKAKPTAGESSSGLGLAIVKRIVAGHGGTISVKSELGEGALFSVSIPIS